jgi:hypothetical protein
LRVIVVDDSTSRAVQAANRELIRKLERDFHQPIQLFDQSYYVTLGVRLRSKGIPPDVVQDALPGGTGQHRAFNGLLLGTLNEAALLTDDRSICHALSSGDHDESLTFTEDSAHTIFFHRGAPAGHVWARSSTDVIAVFERTLGQSLRAVASQWPTRFNVSIERVCSHMLSGFLAHSGKIRVCTTGEVAPVNLERFERWWRSATPPTRPRLVADLTRTQRRHADDNIMLAVSRGYVISHHTQTPISSVVALDNTSLLPPMIAFDTEGLELFRVLLDHCVPEAYHAHLPYALANRSHEPRPDSVQDNARHLPFSEIAAASLAFADLGGEGLDTACRLRRAGATMMHCGLLNEEELENHLRTSLVRASASDLSGWDALSEAVWKSQPSWARRLRRWSNDRTDALRQAEYTVAREMAVDQDMPAARRKTHRWLVRMGRLLRWWPDIVAASLDSAADAPSSGTAMPSAVGMNSSEGMVGTSG